MRILFKTNRFNLSKVGEHFINPCCFGEDLAAWLRIRLSERQVLARAPYQEDWGWELPVTLAADRDDGEWGIIIEKKRSIAQRVRGLGKITANDKLVQTLEEILAAEPSFREIHREG